MNVIALIPARCGSKGVIDKNIRTIGGRTLLERAICVASSASSISRVVVSTDSQRYADIALNAGAEVPFLRPSELAQDNSGDKGWMQHALSRLIEGGDLDIDAVINLRPTTPLRSSRVIDDAVDAFFSLTDRFDSLRSVHVMSESAFKCVERDQNGGLVSITRRFRNRAMFDSDGPRQNLPETYITNGYVDVLKPDLLLNGESIYGEKIFGFRTPFAIEIDSEEDLAIAEAIFQSRSMQTQRIPYDTR